MPSRVLVAFAGVSILAATISTAFASCVTPNEQRADRVRALQTELMVGALKCGSYDGVDIRATYNAFVKRFTPQLVAHAEILKSYFQRENGSVYRVKLDKHVTELANVASLESNAPGYCHHIATLAKAAESETPDELIDSGKAGPGLPVSLGALCEPDQTFVDTVTQAEKPVAHDENEASNGVRKAATSE